MCTYYCGKLLSVLSITHWRIHEGEGQGHAHPPSNFFHFHTVFRQKKTKQFVNPTPPGKSRIRQRYVINYECTEIEKKIKLINKTNILHVRFKRFNIKDNLQIIIYNKGPFFDI